MQRAGARILKTLHQRPIAYYRIYKDILNSTTGGVILSQLMYWSERYDKFWKTNADIIKETGVTKSELRTAKAKIKTLPFITITREGIPARTCYAIDWDEYITYLDNFTNAKLHNKMSEIHTTEEKPQEKADLQMCGIHSTSRVKSTQLYTKTTQRLHVKSISKEIQQTSSVDGKGETLAYNGLLCSICKEPQFETRGGESCINGHGGVEGIEKPKLQKIPIKKKISNHFNYTPQALQILNHWDRLGGKVHSTLPEGKGVRVTKDFIEELLLNGRNPYIKVVDDVNLKVKQWTVHEIISSIDVYAKIKHKSIDKMYFNQFVIINYNGYATRKLRNHSPLVDSFEDIPDDAVLNLKNQLESKFKELYPKEDILPKVLLDCAAFINDRQKIYKVTVNAASLHYDLGNVFVAHVRRIISERGTIDPLKYISGKKFLEDFITYSITKSFRLKKRTTPLAN